MNLPMIAYIVASVMEIEAALMLLPAAVGFGYGERSAWSFVICAGVTALIGLIFLVRKPKNTAFYAREGLVATALSWFVLSAVGAVPFCMTKQIPHYLDALFEMVSGFTTTGSSILQHVEALDKCMLFWRSFSHWIGGMGVLVFMLAILPLSGSGGQNLYLMRAESPGPTVDKLSPKMRSSAAWLYGIYLGLSILCFLVLLIGGMPVFDAACMTFGTAGTGGFGVVASSFNDYSMFCKVADTVFMLLFGINFNFYYLLILQRVLGDDHHRLCHGGFQSVALLQPDDAGADYVHRRLRRIHRRRHQDQPLPHLFQGREQGAPPDVPSPLGAASADGRENRGGRDHSKHLCVYGGVRRDFRGKRYDPVSGRI